MTEQVPPFLFFSFYHCMNTAVSTGKLFFRTHMKLKIQIFKHMEYTEYIHSQCVDQTFYYVKAIKVYRDIEKNFSHCMKKNLEHTPKSIQYSFTSKIMESKFSCISEWHLYLLQRFSCYSLDEFTIQWACTLYAVRSKLPIYN